MNLRIDSGRSRSLPLVALAGVACGIGPALAQPITFQRVIATQAQERGNAIVQTGDGGYAIVGERELPGGNVDIWVARFDSAGNTIWETQIAGPAGNNNNERGLSIVQTFDGGFAIAAETTSSPAGFHTLLLKVGPGGNLFWTRLYEGSQIDFNPELGCRVWEMPNRDLVLVGRRQLGLNTQAPTIIRTDSAGTTIFAFSYVDSRFAVPYGGLLDVRPFVPNSGDVVAVGWTSPGINMSRQAYSLRVDAAGNVISSLGHTPPDLNVYLNGIDVRPNNLGAFVSGRLGTGAPQSFFFSHNGALFATNSQTYGNVVFANATIWERNGEAFLAGRTNSPDAAWFNLSAGGVPLAALRYGGNDADAIRGMFPADSGWAMAGLTRSFTAGLLDDVYFLKSGPQGRTGCNEAPLQVQAQASPWLNQQVPVQRRPVERVNWNPVQLDLESRNIVECLDCPADFNDDGIVDFFDYLDFVASYAVGAPRADFNNDGTVDFFDFLDFAQAFNNGC
ncbi:MAG: GC-type dockerin domain-anchored protein [Planctomycetota bacterium]|nr:GC-type dockerin domain-anchored protein [Planctomycetota bacterium]